MKISILMEKPVLRIAEDASALEAAVMMGKNHVGSLLATRSDANIGIITERDIMSKVIANKRNLETVQIKEILSQPIVTIDQDTDVEKVIEFMAEKGIRRILLTEKEQIVGIFSTSDIIKLPMLNQQ
ncbi:MAG: CBS domain-containing protein [Candidatus Bathyarchaeota archaeon]|nr:MAG: CBS domain-containing protein [Candidatus Bathyarchaeota archaeon]